MPVSMFDYLGFNEHRRLKFFLPSKCKFNKHECSIILSIPILYITRKMKNSDTYKDHIFLCDGGCIAKIQSQKKGKLTELPTGRELFIC